ARVGLRRRGVVGRHQRRRPRAGLAALAEDLVQERPAVVEEPGGLPLPAPGALLPAVEPAAVRAQIGAQLLLVSPHRLGVHGSTVAQRRPGHRLPAAAPPVPLIADRPPPAYDDAMVHVWPL